MKNRFIFLLSILISLFVSCAQGFDNSSADEIQYGSLQYLSSRSNYNLLDVESVVSAKVSVSGDGIDSEISTVCDVQNGIGSFCLQKIPVGKNRIITVQGLDSSGIEISDAVLKALVDIQPGENTISEINRKTSPKAFVYEKLLKNEINISTLSEIQINQLENVIPSIEDCSNNLERIDYESLVSDFKNSLLSSKSITDYLLPETPYLKRLYIEQTETSTKENPKFIAKALYSDSSKVDVTEKVLWIIEDSSVLTCENGNISLLKDGKTRIRAEFTDLNVTRFSQFANFDVSTELAKNNFIYIDISDQTESGINYAKANAAVVAWMWGSGLSSSWYSFEVFEKNTNYMRLEIPSGAEKMVIARGKELQFESSWNGLYNCWNQTSDLNVYNDVNFEGKTVTANTIKLNSWNDATGTWSFIDHGDSLVDTISAKITIDPSEDDTTLSSVTVNGSEVLISRRMFYTIPFDTESAEIIAVPNYSEAKIQISPENPQSIERGSFKEFTIIVTAKDGNVENYVVKVKRSDTEPLNSEKNVKRCYVDNADEKNITFVYDLATWNDVKTDIQSLQIRGSFTTVYNSLTKRWEEDSDNFNFSYDSTYEWFSLTVPYEKVKRPGFSGQPEFRFYKNGKLVEIPEFVEEKYIFKNNFNNQIVIFDSDSDERILQIQQNSQNALVLKTQSDFDLTSDSGKMQVSNFRQVPKTTKLFRSYHPFYPSHENTETEQIRLLQVQEFMQTNGIKSDINLCNDRTETEGMAYSVNGINYTVKIPEYYKSILNSNSVLNVGSVNQGGNGIVPSANFVYYYSDSDLFIKWVSQIVEFICNDNNSAPFLIHCEIGVDRTGVFSAVLGGLCGATWEEVKSDYEKSSLMGINEFRDSNILKYSLENMLKVDDVSTIDLQTELRNYFIKNSISADKIEKVVEKLTN